MAGKTDPAETARAVLEQGPAQRRALAKAITLLESTREDHREDADALLDLLQPHTGKSFRLGISGVPGVGKSTFIETLGLHLVAQGRRVAVLAVDPSSSVSGGSILGDKTRMELLSMNEQAFIRPSPSSGNLGGVAGKTRETLLLCEAAGYDVVIVETVGVGQSETAVAAMTDLFVLLQLPNAGDELQAIKKGVMELADVVVINKADIDPSAAMRARAQISSALHASSAHGRGSHTPPWRTHVMQVSALTGDGMETFWTTISGFLEQERREHRFAARRRNQDIAWMKELIASGLQYRFRRHAAVRAALPDMSSDVLDGRLAPSVAARRLLAMLDTPGTP